MAGGLGGDDRADRRPVRRPRVVALLLPPRMDGDQRRARALEQAREGDRLGDARLCADLAEDGDGQPLDERRDALGGEGRVALG